MKDDKTIYQVACKLIKTIDGFMAGKEPSAGWRMMQELSAISLHRKSLYDTERRHLVDSLRQLAKRADDYADRIEGPDNERTLGKMVKLAHRIEDDTRQLRAQITKLRDLQTLDAVINPDTAPKPMKVIGEETA
jgi:hypothetical protein